MRDFYRFLEPKPKTKEIVYQMVDNTYPLSTEHFQEEIENIFVVVGKPTLTTRYKIRYINILVDINMTNTEILNLGKRIAIIEQRIINKSKILCNNTIHKTSAYKITTELTDNQLAIIAIGNIEKIIANNKLAIKHKEGFTVNELSTQILKTITQFKKDTEKIIKKIIKNN